MHVEHQDAHKGSVHVPGTTPISRSKDLWFTRRAGIALVMSFLTLCALTVAASMIGLVGREHVPVLLWSLLGLYFAFGILIGAYRVISKVQ